MTVTAKTPLVIPSATDERTMPAPQDWTPSKPVAFAWLLCLLMLAGEIVSGGFHNPMTVVFYCFLPAALWMISRDQRRDAREIVSLRDRVDRLEDSRRTSLLTKTG